MGARPNVFAASGPRDLAATFGRTHCPLRRVVHAQRARGGLRGPNLGHTREKPRLPSSPTSPKPTKAQQTRARYTPMLPSPSARLADPVWETQLRRLPAEGSEAVINECIDELRLEVDNRTAADAGDRCDAHGWVPSARGRRIWDMFIVDREIDLVEARIAELFPYVDFFVIAEANQTHQGHAKGSHVRGAWRTRLARFASKVVPPVCLLPCGSW